MSNGDTPKPDASKILHDSIVKAAQEAIAGMFGTAVEAMSKDTKALLDKNGAANPPPAKAVKALTGEIIASLGASLRAVLPKTEPGKDKASGETEEP
jgi:hypothetical protein